MKRYCKLEDMLKIKGWLERNFDNLYNRFSIIVRNSPEITDESTKSINLLSSSVIQVASVSDGYHEAIEYLSRERMDEKKYRILSAVIIYSLTELAKEKSKDTSDLYRCLNHLVSENEKVFLEEES